MLDLAFIRNNPDAVKEAARLKNNTLDIDYLLEVDRKVTTLQRQVEDTRAATKSAFAQHAEGGQR